MGTVNQAMDERMAGLNVLGQSVRVASPVPRFLAAVAIESRGDRANYGGLRLEMRRNAQAHASVPHPQLQVWSRALADASVKVDVNDAIATTAAANLKHTGGSARAANPIEHESRPTCAQRRPRGRTHQSRRLRWWPVLACRSVAGFHLSTEAREEKTVMGSISVKKIVNYAGVSGIQGTKSYYGWQNPNPVAVYAFSLELSQLGGGYPKHVELSPLRYYRDATDTVVRWSVTNLTSSITYYHIHMSVATP